MFRRYEIRRPIDAFDAASRSIRLSPRHDDFRARFDHITAEAISPRLRLRHYIVRVDALSVIQIPAIKQAHELTVISILSISGPIAVS